jgi:tetratricopeptide (TPR) repeat protein
MPRPWLAAAASVLCWGLSASAQNAPTQSDRDKAEQHFNSGYALVEAREYEAAAAQFEQAYQLSPHHSVLFNLGLAYSLAGKHVQAVQTLRRFLEQPDQAEPGMVTRARTALRKSESLVGTVRLTVSPGTTVVVDGRAVAQPSEPQVLSIGTHGVWAQAPGRRDGYRSFVVNGGDTTEVELLLAPLPAEPPPIKLKPKPKQLAQPNDPPSHLWSYVLGGTGLALGAGAVALYVKGSADHRDLQDRRDELTKEHTAGTLTQHQREEWALLMSDAASQQRWDDVAIGLGICAGVSLGTAIALFSRSSPNVSERAQVSFDGRRVSWSAVW